MKFIPLFGILISFLISGTLTNCTPVNSQGTAVTITPPEGNAFNDYWYQGKAELTRYKLEQARYGEIHEGDAVMIFVTEDFLVEKQVKYEHATQGDTPAKILKLNLTKKFLTGIYPYSMMSSIFTPVAEDGKTFKVSTSSQEWCGHTYSQLNLRDGKYEGLLHSYFQDEGDQQFSLDGALLEDEIWAKIRLHPESLPTGNIQLIPATQFLRLRHVEYSVEDATASLNTTKDGSLSDQALSTYRIEYKNLPRVLEITFETAFPYTIVAWQEEMESGWPEAKKLTTRAVRTHSVMSPYWSQNDLQDRGLRKDLGLSEQ